MRADFKMTGASEKLKHLKIIVVAQMTLWFTVGSTEDLN